MTIFLNHCSCRVCIWKPEINLIQSAFAFEVIVSHPEDVMHGLAHLSLRVNVGYALSKPLVYCATILKMEKAQVEQAHKT